MEKIRGALLGGRCTRVDRQIDVPLAPPPIDRVRQDAEFAVYGAARDDSQSLITIPREIQTRECEHANPCKGRSSPRFEPKVGRLCREASAADFRAV